MDWNNYTWMRTADGRKIEVRPSSAGARYYLDRSGRGYWINDAGYLTDTLQQQEYDAKQKRIKEEEEAKRKSVANENQIGTNNSREVEDAGIGALGGAAATFAPRVAKATTAFAMILIAILLIASLIFEGVRYVFLSTIAFLDSFQTQCATVKKAFIWSGVPLSILVGWTLIPRFILFLSVIKSAWKEGKVDWIKIIIGNVALVFVSALLKVISVKTWIPLTKSGDNTSWIVPSQAGTIFKGELSDMISYIIGMIVISFLLSMIIEIITVRETRLKFIKIVVISCLLVGGVKLVSSMSHKVAEEVYSNVEWIASDVKKGLHSWDYDDEMYELELDQYTFEAQGAVHYEEVKMDCAVTNNTNFVWDNCLLVYSVSDSSGRIVSPEDAVVWMGRISPGDTAKSDGIIVAGNTGCKSEEALTFKAEHVYYTINYEYADAEEGDFDSDLRFVRDSERDEYNDYLYLEGSITNNTDRDWHHVTIDFDVVNDKGKKLKKDKDYSVFLRSEKGLYGKLQFECIKAGETVEIDETYGQVGKKSKKKYNARFSEFSYYYVKE